MGSAASSKLPKSSQRKHQPETNLKCCIIIDRTPEINPLDVSFQPSDRDYVVATSRRVL
jgi:hypothetical protein